MIGGITKIKPVLKVSKEGKIESTKKVIGTNKAMKAILDYMNELGVDQSYPVYTLYSYGEKNISTFEEKLLLNHYTVNKRIQIGPAIGSHVGTEAFAVVFVRR